MPQIGDYARLNRVYVNSEVKSKVFLLYLSLILLLKAMHLTPGRGCPACLDNSERRSDSGWFIISMQRDLRKLQPRKNLR